MSLQKMDFLLRKAQARGMALGAFECWDSFNIQGIAMASAKCGVPVIFQATSTEYSLMGGPEALADIVNFYVRRYQVEAALHLDHGKNQQEVEECLTAGFTSVMLDASSFPFEENIALSAAAAAAAHEGNASCEAELGHVGGGDGGGRDDSVLTVPEEAAEFVRRTQVDCLAVAIGTVHGEYRGKPELRLDRLEEIAGKVTLPLVLHGGSGTPAALLRRAIQLGVAKINICTDLNKAFLRGMEEAKQKLSPAIPGKYYRPALEALTAQTEALIRLFCGEER